MATMKPFKGLRPKKGLEDKIAALPYDVYSREEAKIVIKENPHSFLTIDRAETSFGNEVGTYDTCVYEKARELFLKKIEDGEFIQDNNEVFYIYELSMGERVQTGLVTCALIDDYLSNVIKKHENTRADKEVDRIKHVSSLEAQTGPIFLAYREDAKVSKIIDDQKRKDVLYDFVSDDHVRHRVWILDQENDIQTIVNEFEKMNALYIADGHHRCASAVKVGMRLREENPNHTGEEEYNYFLSVIFPDNQLKIMDYNRVIKDLNGQTVNEIIEHISKFFHVSEPCSTARKPSKKGEIGMFINKDWYSLVVKEEMKKSDPVDGLDVTLLQDYILSPVFGITDPTTDKRIDFVGGIRGLEELERRVGLDCKIAFAMFPTSISELFAVADEGRLMPPKSTWFEPKLRSGLFVHRIV